MARNGEASSASSHRWSASAAWSSGPGTPSRRTRPVTIALRPAILIASFFAALAAVVEIPAAVVAILILALT